MAYTKQTWEDSVTALSAEHLNHMETGIKGAHDGIDDANTAITSAQEDIETLTTDVTTLKKNTFGANVVVPRTLSDSNTKATFNYTFPNDGYLVVYIGASNINTIQTWALAISDRIAIPLVTDGGVPPAMANTVTYVRKGMKLTGYVDTTSSTHTSKITPTFIPIA